MYKNDLGRINRRVESICKIDLKNNASPKLKAKYKIDFTSPQGSPKTINYQELVKIYTSKKKKNINIEEISDKDETNHNKEKNLMCTLGLSQDFYQKINLFKTLIFEIYRVLMGCFLLLFVPQRCDSDNCSLKNYIIFKDYHLSSVFYFNFLFFLNTLILYYFEIRREITLINYLEVNKYKALDSKSVGNALEKLSSKRRQKLIILNTKYMISGSICIFLFLINTLVTSYIMYFNYLDSSTITVLITNFLFLNSKMSSVYSIINNEDNIFFSAFLKNKVQYNDVDPDKVEN